MHKRPRWGLGASDGLNGLFCHLKIVASIAARGQDQIIKMQICHLMAPPDNGHFAPFGLNAGLMAFLLGHLAHRIRKGERVLKVLEAIAALDAFDTIAMGHRPIWVLGQKVSQF